MPYNMSQDDKGICPLPKDVLNFDDIVTYMWVTQNINFISLIGDLRTKPYSKSRISIPLCHLFLLPLVRLILEVVVQLLENEFVNGYREGDRVLYVSHFY
jgi:hypothetical protein